MPKDRTISKPEDRVIREWVEARHGVRLPQFFLWKLTTEEAVQKMKGEYPGVFKELTAEQIEKAARR